MVSLCVCYGQIFAHRRSYDKGDSLSPSSMRQDTKQICSGLQTWLKAIFGTSFKNNGSTFKIGRQEDGHSCGICVINSLEHELFGTPLFTHKIRNTLRICYFIETMEFLLKDVRMRHSSNPMTES